MTPSDRPPTTLAEWDDEVERCAYAQVEANARLQEARSAHAEASKALNAAQKGFDAFLLSRRNSMPIDSHWGHNPRGSTA